MLKILVENRALNGISSYQSAKSPACPYRMENLRLTVALLLVSAPTVWSQTVASDVPRDTLLFAKVQLDSSVKLSKLKLGDSVTGRLARDIYSSDNKVYVQGSAVHLIVDGTERKRKIPGAQWPWIARLFLPRHENAPLFKEAFISMPDGSESRIQASLLSSDRMRQVRPSNGREKTDAHSLSAAKGAAPQSGTEPRTAKAPVLYLEARLSPEQESKISDAPRPSIPIDEEVPAGTSCSVLLLNSLSGAKSHSGDAIQARLLEPVIVDSRVVLPAGSLFEGRVLKSTPPRIPSRAGSLTIAFESVTLPGRIRIPVSASVASLEVKTSSPTKLDREGRLHGSHPGTAWLLVNGGVSAALDKVADDTTQLVIEAIVESATDASTAGAARIAGTAVSGVFLLTRKGQDVVLPSHTEMSITLNRPLVLSAQTLSPGPPQK